MGCLRIDLSDQWEHMEYNVYHERFHSNFLGLVELVCDDVHDYLLIVNVLSVLLLNVFNLVCYIELCI